MDLDIINLTDESYLMSPEYNNLSDFTVNNLEELSEIIRQAEAEETKHSAPAPIPSTADVVKRADPVQPSSQTAPEEEVADGQQQQQHQQQRQRRSTECFSQRLYKRVPTQCDSLIGEQSPVISFIPDPFSDIDFAITELNHPQAVLNTISQCQDLLNQIPAKPSTSNDTHLQTETRLDNNQSAQNQTNVFNAIDHAVYHLENVQRATSDRQNQWRGGNVEDVHLENLEHQYRTQQNSPSSRVVTRPRFNCVESSHPLNVNIT
ncbi:hypothetical protein ABVT39_017233 [Epinephelus coioides]